MGKARLSNFTLIILGGTALLGAVGLLGLSRSPAQHGLEPSLMAPDGNPRPTERAAVSSRVRSSVLGHARLTVVCAQDRQPVAGATVRIGANDELSLSKPLQATHGSTSREGVVEVPCAMDGELEVEVVARGYRTWQGTCDVVTGSGSIELQGCGAVRVVHKDGREFPAGSVVTVRRLGSRAVTDEASLQHAAEGREVQVSGLRPGGHYELALHSPAGPLDLDRTRVAAGWPEPTCVVASTRDRVGREIVVLGVEPQDCPQLRVALSSPGREGSGAQPRWDAERGVGVAVPVPFGAREPNELVVRGPLGVVLHRGPLSGDRRHEVTLELERILVPLVRPADRPVADDWILWHGESTGSAGLSDGGQAIQLLATTSSPASVVDLQWDDLSATGVELPRRDPIEFLAPKTGELRLVDVAGRELSVKSWPQGRAQELIPVGDQLWATVISGRYRVWIEDRAVGAPIHVAPGEIRHVPIAGLERHAGLRVVFPSATSEASADAPHELLITLTQRGSTNRLLRQTSWLASDGEARLEDLPPGEVLVALSSEPLGRLQQHVVLRAGEETSVEFRRWSAPRDVTFLLERDDGEPLAGEPFQVAWMERGQASTRRGVTDDYGEAVMRLAGGGEITVGSSRGFCVEQLGEEESFLAVQFGDGEAERLRVHLRGWWRDKVRSVGVLRRRGAVTEFLPGAQQPEPETYEVPRGDAFVVVVLLRDRSKLFVEPPKHGGGLVLEHAPAALRIRVAPPPAGDRPEMVLLHLERIGGIDVSGTAFARALGPTHAFGGEVEITQAATLDVLVEAAAGHGGIVWRSDPVTLEPGVSPEPIALGAIR